MTWALMGLAGLLWLFRKRIGRALQPYFPDRVARQRVLGLIIAAFLIVAVLRLIVRFFGW